MNKQVLRKQKMLERNGLSAETLQAFSDIIIEKVIGLNEYKSASKILCYVSCRSEAFTDRLIEHALKTGKTVGVPKVYGERMRFYEIHDIADLEPGYFGIPEPKSEIIEKYGEVEPDNSFMVVPGLAFDMALNRIGYGKGFYDRYFAENEGKLIFKCGIGFDLQVVEKIEADANDQPLDMLVTEKRIISN